MNNKGFTLIEMLAVVIILGIVGLIAVGGTLTAIDKSREKSEEIFVSKISSYIERYIKLSGNITHPLFDLTEDEIPVYSKEYNGVSEEVKINYLGTIKMSDLIGYDMLKLKKDSLVNPRTKKPCDEFTVHIFKDDDYVYYYNVDLTKACDIKRDEIGIINTIPDDDICEEYKGNIDSLKCDGDIDSGDQDYEEEE